MKHRESLWGNSTSQSKGVISNGREKQLRQSSCRSSQSASNSTHRTVWVFHIRLLPGHGPRLPDLSQASRSRWFLLCVLGFSPALLKNSAVGEVLSRSCVQVPFLCSLSLINRYPAQRRHPAFPGCLAQQSGRWSPLPRWRLNWKVTLCCLSKA